MPINDLKKNDDNVWSNPLALEEEKIFFVQRKHWLVLTPFLFSLATSTLISLVILYYVSLFLQTDYILLMIVGLCLLTFTSTLIIKVVTEWYFTVYILTSRRLLEISYTPLAAYVLNNVLLEQVRCTEIDTNTSGLLYKYLDIGDIIVTFDRPTHRDAFMLQSIKNCHTLSHQLCTLLLPVQQSQTNQSFKQLSSRLPSKTIWVKPKKLVNKFNPFDEIFSKGNNLNYPTIHYGI